jgi:hypothetical protein
MRIAGIALAVVASVSSAYANENDDKKACIIDAAQKLPNIAGLQIKKSSATVDAKDSKPGTTFWQVDIDFAAAGQDVRWSFLCVILPDGNPRAQRTK